MRSSNSCCCISVEPRRRVSRDVDEFEELSTTTPTGLNHNILSSVEMLSSSEKNEPIPPISENVISISTTMVNKLTIIFLDNVKNLSAVDHTD